MALHLDVHQEQKHGEENQEHARQIDRKRLEREKGEKNADPSYDAGQDGARIGELEDEPVEAENEQDVRDVGIQDPAEELLPPARGDLVTDGVLGVERAGEPRDGHLAPVHLLRELVEVARHVIHDVELQRLVLRERTALADRLLRPVRVPAALRGERADVADRVVPHLVGHRRVHAAAAEVHRRGRADRRAGRHGRHVGSVGDERPRRGGAAPRGRDEDHDRHFGDQDALDDVAHRGVQSAGRIELDHERLALVALGPPDRLHDHLRRDRLDGSVDREHVEDRFVGGGGGRGHARRAEEEQNRGESKERDANERGAHGHQLRSLCTGIASGRRIWFFSSTKTTVGT